MSRCTWREGRGGPTYAAIFDRETRIIATLDSLEWLTLTRDEADAFERSDIHRTVWLNGTPITITAPGYRPDDTPPEAWGYYCCTPDRDGFHARGCIAGNAQLPADAYPRKFYPPTRT